MTPYDLSGHNPHLLLSRTRGLIGWATVERDWPPPQWPAVLTGLPAMLVGCVSIINARERISAGIGRFSLQ